jgi:L-malate glycosyltransferase
MREGPLTILQLTFQGDGAGSTQSILNLSEALARRGHRVLVGCRPASLLFRSAEAARLETVPLDFSRLGPLARALRAAASRARVDVVNSHATRDRRALTWLRWRGRLPQAFVVTRRTMPLTSALELRLVGLAADRTIAVSGAVARALVERWHPVDRLRVVPNGIDLSRIDAEPAAADLAEARAALGDVGARRVVAVIARRKDQDVLLAALGSVESPVLLACVGIEADATLLARAAALPQRHRAVFIPFVPRPLAFYRLAAAVALPSRIEGLSQTLLEAMALGLPVVASDAGGNPDLIRGGRTGLLVPPLDAAAWAGVLTRLLDDPGSAARIGAAGRVVVRRDFTIGRTAERTEAVYREARERRIHE